jgi:hypothetical protein
VQAERWDRDAGRGEMPPWLQGIPRVPGRASQPLRTARTRPLGDKTVQRTVQRANEHEDRKAASVARDGRRRGSGMLWIAPAAQIPQVG